MAFLAALATRRVPLEGGPGGGAGAAAGAAGGGGGGGSVLSPRVSCSGGAPVNAAGLQVRSGDAMWAVAVWAGALGAASALSLRSARGRPALGANSGAA
jgi:hypothetical protein